MANTNLNVILKAVKQGKGVVELEQELKGLKEKGEQTTNQTKQLTMAQKALVAGLAAAAVAVGREAVELYELGAQSKRAETALVAFAGGSSEAEAALEGIERASGGALDKMSAAQNAARLFSMGLADTASEAEQLAKIGITLGTAMGRDTQAAFEEFSLLLANQSIPRLDTFGISAAAVRQRIGELQSEVQGMSREEAFKLAVVEIGTERLKDLEAQGYESATSLERLKATWQNMKLGTADIIFGAAENANPNKIVEFGNAYSELGSQVGKGNISLAKANFLMTKAILLPGTLAEEVDKLVRVEEQQNRNMQTSLGTFAQIVDYYGIMTDAASGFEGIPWEDEILGADEASAALEELKTLMSVGLTEGFEKAKDKTVELREEEATLIEKIKELESITNPTSAQQEDLEKYREKLGDVQGEIDQVAEAWDRQTKQMIFNLAQQRLAMDGLTNEELSALAKLAGPQGFGLVDEAGQSLIETIAGSADALSAAGDQSDIFVDVLGQANAVVSDLTGSSADLQGELEGLGSTLDGIAGDYQVRIKITTSGNVPQMTGGSTININSGPIREAYADGGSFLVDGMPGRDRVPVSFMAEKGERVSIFNAEQQRNLRGSGSGDQPVTVNVYLDNRLVQQSLARGARLQGVG